MKMCSMHLKKDDTVAKIRKVKSAKRQIEGIHRVLFYFKNLLVFILTLNRSH